MDGTKTLVSPKQAKALEALLQGKTLREAAKAARVSFPTIQWWLYHQPDDSFRQAFDEQRRAIMNELGHKTPQAIAKAMDVIIETFEYEDPERDQFRVEAALKFVGMFFSKGNNINIIQSNAYDNSQNLTVSSNGNTSGAPLDAQQLDPATIDAFVDALRSAVSDRSTFSDAD